jgi:hypothetical protein
LGILDSVLSPSGGPLLDLSILGGPTTKTAMTPEVMNVESLNLYLPKEESAPGQVINGLTDILSQAMPFLFILIFMQSMNARRS